MSWPWLPIAALLVVNLLIGIWVVRDFGMSVDEPNIYHYAAHTVANYTGLLRGSPPLDFNRVNLDFYGPIFFTGAWALARTLHHFLIHWTVWDGWHFSYFLAFQVALLSLYALSRRWMSSWAAMGAVLLFETQPVLWGHAFINPKDIPFMAAFLATLALGFAFVDRIAARATYPEVRGPERWGVRGVGGSVLRPLAGQALGGFRDPVLLLAAVMLGLTTSIRVLGPYAGVLVILYALYRCPRRTPGLLVPYGLVAMIVAFLTWPYLWTDPLHRFIQSLTTMSDYPWTGTLLFEGRLLTASEIPWRFIPKLMVLQFTEPALLLFVGGVVLAGWKLVREHVLEPFLLLVLWLVLPLASIIFAGSTVYNGFRQVLFLVPPIFIACGLTIDWVFKRVHRGLLRALVLLVLVAPGVFWIVSLHPYEYIYYNSLAGGVSGAFGKYDLDYWATSFREAAQYVNQTACPKTQVVVYRSPQNYAPYSRTDLTVISPNDVPVLTDKGELKLEYAVFPIRSNRDLAKLTDNVTVKTVERDGAILSVVKKVPLPQGICP